MYVFYVEQAERVIRVITADGQLVTIAGLAAPADGLGPTARFSGPAGIRVIRRDHRRRHLKLRHPPVHPRRLAAPRRDGIIEFLVTATLDSLDDIKAAGDIQDIHNRSRDAEFLIRSRF